MFNNAVFSLVLSLFIVVGSVHSTVAQSSADQVRVSDIRVDGNRRVADGTVKSYLSIQVGDLTSLNALSSALNSLYDTELFQDIKLDLDGSILLVSVVENPVINRVNIEGNDAISDDLLLEMIDVQPRRIFNRNVAIDATRKLIEVYRQGGRFAALVEPKIIELDENRIDLIFEINEGPLIKIDSIAFFGNAAFTDQELRQKIASREKRWWAFLSANDKYDEGRLDYDVRLLRQFYLARGFADINIERARGGLLPDRSGFAITFLVNEGVRYKVNEVSISSEIKGIDVDKMSGFIDFNDESWYDVRYLEQGLLDISNELGSLGYAFVNVTPNIETNSSKAELDIKINIEEARRNFVERIEFINNVRTTDSVIRREFEIVEGDAYDQLKIDRSIRNVRNLGFFSDVKVQTLSGSTSDQSVTKVTVEEQSTGDLALGLGYSSLDQTTVSIGINERNFLGTGRRAKILLSTSGTATDFNIGLSEPYFMGRNLTGSLDAFKMKTTENDSTRNENGFTLGIDYAAARDIAHKLRYNLSQTKTTLSSQTATSTTGENNKSLLKSSVTYVLSQDTRNNRFDPTEGFYTELDETISGLGGDVKFLRTRISAAYYKPLLFQSVILGVSGKLGYIAGLGDKVTRSQHFYLGGRDIRGFDSTGLGPRDTGSKSAVGGKKMYSGRFEVISSIGLNEDTGIRWTVFTDFGSLWDTDYPTGVIKPNASKVRSSLGAGFFWSTAIGPLSFSWAKPLSQMPHDTTRTFQFNIGTRL
ncbi:outer membrane protein assembly factor BamA [Candidatus Puniceispirillum sp.]|nr:outer membrane protein assembly factor BamA [Candidatus Puniceispirillum sp.]